MNLLIVACALLLHNQFNVLFNAEFKTNNSLLFIIISMNYPNFILEDYF